MSGTYYFKLLFPSTSLNRILFDGEEKNLPRIVKGLGKSGSLIKRDFNFVFFTMKHLCKVDLLQVVPEASKQTACNYNWIISSQKCFLTLNEGWDGDGWI